MRLEKPLAVVFVPILVSQTSVYSQVGARADRILSAEQLEKRCSSNDNSEVGRLNLSYCIGAITGISDAATTLTVYFERDQVICLEQNDNADSMRLAFLSYLQRNPDDRELPAATVVITALVRNYPCKAG